LPLPTGVDVLRTSGFTRGDLIRDGALTQADRVAHPFAIVKTLDGGWLRRDPRTLTVDQMGADSTGTSDSASAIQATIDYLQAFYETRGVDEVGMHPVRIGAGKYRVNSMITRRSADLIGESSPL
jgi:hypothetical protein